MRRTAGIHGSWDERSVVVALISTEGRSDDVASRYAASVVPFFPWPAVGPWPCLPAGRTAPIAN